MRESAGKHGAMPKIVENQIPELISGVGELVLVAGLDSETKLNYCIYTRGKQMLYEK